MEAIRTDIRENPLYTSFSTPDVSSAVYRSTTYEVRHPKKSLLYNKVLPKDPKDEEDTLELRPFENLPPRTPVDLQFKDVTYYVNTGFIKKG